MCLVALRLSVVPVYTDTLYISVDWIFHIITGNDKVRFHLSDLDVFVTSTGNVEYYSTWVSFTCNSTQMKPHACRNPRQWNPPPPAPFSKPPTAIIFYTMKTLTLYISHWCVESVQLLNAKKRNLFSVFLSTYFTYVQFTVPKSLYKNNWRNY